MRAAGAGLVSDHAALTAPPASAEPLAKAAQVKAAPVPLALGINQHDPGFDKRGNIKPTQGGTSSAYRLGVLKRDHPDIAERYATGEFRSVSAAERAAGKRFSTKRKRLTDGRLTPISLAAWAMVVRLSLPRFTMSKPSKILGRLNPRRATRNQVIAR